nr:MAG TPA: hypothetical protein [Caudoviricetes sp.]
MYASLSPPYKHSLGRSCKGFFLTLFRERKVTHYVVPAS